MRRSSNLINSNLSQLKTTISELLSQTQNTKLSATDFIEIDTFEHEAVLFQIYFVPTFLNSFCQKSSFYMEVLWSLSLIGTEKSPLNMWKFSLTPEGKNLFFIRFSFLFHKQPLLSSWIATDESLVKNIVSQSMYP